MKKRISLVLVLLCVFCVFVNAEEATEHAEYTIYNTTGELVKELYLYDVCSEEKGENRAGEEGLADGESVVLTLDATKEEAESAVFVLEFVVDGQEARTFETLHFEVAPISLLAVDAMTGATPIAFSEPQ